MIKDVERNRMVRFILTRVKKVKELEVEFIGRGTYRILYKGVSIAHFYNSKKKREIEAFFTNGYEFTKEPFTTDLEYAYNEIYDMRYNYGQKKAFLFCMIIIGIFYYSIQ